MPKTAQNRKENYTELLLYFFLLLILFLTALNIDSYLKENKVLGASTQNTQNIQQQYRHKFWNDFLSKNPDYIPGWVEIGREDQVKQIDPNY